MSGAVELWLVALALSLPLGAAAGLLGTGLARRTARPDRVWSAACFAALTPLALAWPAAMLAQSAPAAFDPGWFTGPGDGAAAAVTGASIAAHAAMDAALPIGLILFVVWITGALARLALEAWRSVKLARVLNACGPAAADRALLAAQIARRMGLRRTPELRLGADGLQPFTAGLIRPVIVIPAGLGREALRCVLTHELCHVRRGDVWRSFGLRGASALLWFNPFWFASLRRRRAAVETVCDLTALDAMETGGARFYARTLLAAARAGLGRLDAVGFGVADKRMMEMRLKAILAHAPNRARKGGLLPALAVLALAAPAGLAQAVQAAGAQGGAAFTHAVLEGKITSGFGPSKVAARPQKFHDGTDIAAAENTVVFAPADGEVKYADTGLNGQDAYGKVMVIDHGSGWTTMYAHLNDFAAKKGDRVSAGDPVAYVGSTGVSSGPHLHVEVRENGAPVDPALHLPGLAQD